MTETVKRLSGLLQHEWREPTQAYRISSRAYVGMPDEMKAALREASEILSRREGRRVSISEVMRRLAAAGGLEVTDDADTTIDGHETMEHRWRRTQALVVETNKRLDALAAERDRLKRALCEIANSDCEPCGRAKPCHACIAAKALEGKDQE